MPVDQIYWGWNAIGNWARVSLLVKEAGNYTASVFGTCNSGGQLTLTVDDYAKAGAAEVRVRCALVVGGEGGGGRQATPHAGRPLA